MYPPRHHATSARCIAAILAATLAWNSAAVAGPIVNVGTSWTLSFNQGSTGQATVSVSNVGDAFAEFNGVALGFVLVPVSGSGTLDLVNFSAPATNPLFTQGPPEYILQAISTLDAPITVSGTDYTSFYPAFAANNTAFNEQLAASQSKNMGTLEFSAADGTLGTWQVYLANQASPQKSFYSTTSPSSDFTFDDLPAIDGSLVLIGTVQVVPEPSTLVGLLAGGVAVAAYRGRKRRARAG